MLTYTELEDYSKELESDIIGACLLENTAVARIYNTIKPEHFYYIEHQNIAKAIWQMFDENKPIDLLTVCQYMVLTLKIYYADGRPGSDKNNSDVPYKLAKTTTPVCSTANLEYWAFLLKEMYLNREIKRLTFCGISEENLNENPQKKIEKLFQELQKLNEETPSEEWVKMDDLVYKLLTHQDNLAASGGKGLQTGFKHLDELTGGFFPGNLIVLAARPGVGKSAFAGQIALNVAHQNKNVGIITLEMENIEISARIASIDTNTDFKVVHRGLFRDQDQRDRFYDRVVNSTANLPIYISDKAKATITDIKAKAGQLKSKYGLDLLIIDYLQLIATDHNKNKTRENEVSEISKTCKVLAKDLKVPVIELCQLNRAVTHRKGSERYPILSDLRESGSIEQDADIVMFLHSDFYSGRIVDENNESTEGKADLLIEKSRNGAHAQIKFLFDGPKMKFSERKKDTVAPFPFAELKDDETENDSPF